MNDRYLSEATVNIVCEHVAQHLQHMTLWDEEDLRNGIESVVETVTFETGLDDRGSWYALEFNPKACQYIFPIGLSRGRCGGPQEYRLRLNETEGIIEGQTETTGGLLTGSSETRLSEEELSTIGNAVQAIISDIWKGEE